MGNGGWIRARGVFLSYFGTIDVLSTLRTSVQAARQGEQGGGKAERTYAVLRSVSSYVGSRIADRGPWAVGRGSPDRQPVLYSNLNRLPALSLLASR